MHRRAELPATAPKLDESVQPDHGERGVGQDIARVGDAEEDPAIGEVVVFGRLLDRRQQPRSCHREQDQCDPPFVSSQRLEKHSRSPLSIESFERTDGQNDPNTPASTITAASATIGPTMAVMAMWK